jgi:hypothetical protein
MFKRKDSDSFSFKVAFQNNSVKAVFVDGPYLLIPNNKSIISPNLEDKVMMIYKN